MWKCDWRTYVAITMHATVENKCCDHDASHTGAMMLLSRSRLQLQNFGAVSPKLHQYCNVCFFDSGLRTNYTRDANSCTQAVTKPAISSGDNVRNVAFNCWTTMLLGSERRTATSFFTLSGPERRTLFGSVLGSRGFARGSRFGLHPEDSARSRFCCRSALPPVKHVSHKPPLPDHSKQVNVLQKPPLRSFSCSR
jgi:hypothetical protein